jgi:hypothetical protein
MLITTNYTLSSEQSIPGPIPGPKVTRKSLKHRPGSAAVWIGVVILVGAVLAGGLAVWLFVRPPAVSLPADLALVPANAQGFYAVRVADVWNLPEANTIRRFVPPEALRPLKDFEAKVGMAITDLDRVTLVATNVQKKEVFVVFSLNKPYDRKKIMDLFPPGTRETNGPKVYHVFPGPEQTSVYFAHERMIVVGAGGGIERCLKQMESPETSGPLAAALKTAAGVHHVVAGFSVPADLKDQLTHGLPPGAANLGIFLEARTGTLVLDQKDQAMQLDVRLDFPNDGMAQQAKAAADGLLAAGKLLLPGLKAKFGQAPEAQQLGNWLDKTLNRIKPEQKGAMLALNLKIDTSGLTESLARLGPEIFSAVGKVRQAAKRTQHMNNLRQLALAMISYADSHQGRMPAAVIRAQDGKPLYSWRVELLPYLEQQALYHEFHRNEPWDSPHNSKLLARMPDVFRLPGQPATSALTHYLVFTGPDTPFPDKQTTRFPASFRDGTSNTILIAESFTGVHWTRPDDIPFDGKQKLLNRLGGHFGNVFHVAMADGSIMAVPKTISETTLINAITPNGGIPLDPDWPGRR